MPPIQLSSELKKLGYENFQTKEISCFTRNRNGNAFPNLFEIIVTNAVNS